jgi:hypothetical protein
MTLRIQLEQLITSRGVSEKDAEEIVQLAIMQDNDSSELNVKFDDDKADYPTSVLRAVYFSFKPYIVKWIDQNKPQAWYRPMFL